MSSIRSSIVLSALALFFVASQAVHGQYRLPIDEASPTFHVEIAKPFFEEGVDFGAATAMIDATAVVPLQAGSALFARLGLTRATLEGVDASTLLSNLRVGAIFTREGGSHGELHVDLPTASEIGDDDYATGVALAIDPERLARFIPEGWAIGGTITRQSQPPSGGTLGARLGVEAWIPTESGADTEFLAIYSGFGRASFGNAFIDAEVSGIAVLSEEDLSFGERTLFLGTITLGFPGSAMAPEIFLRLPLDEDTQT